MFHQRTVLEAVIIQRQVSRVSTQLHLFGTSQRHLIAISFDSMFLLYIAFSNLLNCFDEIESVVDGVVETLFED